MENDLLLHDETNFNLEWSIFFAALKSYNSEIYLDKEIIDYAPKDVIEKLWIKIANCKRNGIQISETDQRFHSVVMNKQKFRLSLVPSQEMDELLGPFHYSNNKLSENVDKTKLMLFKVNYIGSENNESIYSFCDKYGSFLALHGSAVNRFYSILQNGLRLPKTNDNPGLYGFGIYLTNKLDVAFHFAPAHLFDCGWLKDESIKLAAICHIAKHPNAVVRKEHKTSDGFSFDSGIPPEYYLVKDESMVHITHILVESSCQVSCLQSRARSEPRQHDHSRLNIIDGLLATFRRNWLLYTVAIYIGLLIIVGFFKGRCVIFSDWDNSDLLTIDD